MKLDYYNPLVPTGYCGLYTLIAGIKVYGSKRDTNFESQAKSIVTQIAQNLPSWITGFKFHYTIYIDKTLETKGDIDLGFLWRKGDKILIMDASTRDYSYQDPPRNLNWNTNEWNNKKYVNHSNSRIDLELK